MTVAQSSDEVPAGLYVNSELDEVIEQAFEHYATGKYSDRDIADWMNTIPIIQQIRAGQKPIGKEMIRDLLRNRVYTGRVPLSA